MDIRIPKPKYLQRQCSDINAFISTHSIDEYKQNFPVIRINKKKIYNNQSKNIFKENINK